MAFKPELHLNTAMPEPNPDFKQTRSATRSPRFREDFDAPFSEALLNASTVTLSTESDRSPLSLSQLPGDIPAKEPPVPPRPVQSREDSWSSMQSSRSTGSTSSGVNDKIREWARRSFLALRRSDDGAASRPS